MRIDKCLNIGDVLASIRLQLRDKSAANKVWIIVEGETDQRLFSNLIKPHHVEFEIAPAGVNSLLEIVSTLLKETKRILGIRDADFLHLDGKSNTAENIFLTDFHDAEMMIISCDEAYRKVAAEFLTKEKEPYSLREKVIESITFIGGLRWINHIDDLELKFDGLGLGRCYDGKTAVLNEDGYINAIIKRSPNKKKEISKEEVRSKIDSVSDCLNLCSGHDFQKAFALYVSSKDEVIGSAFRLAYRFEDFQETNLYKQLKRFSDEQSLSLF
ncbi:hypothetical protein MCHI_003134 [Candidatus Magnetoovum chiemensis]|nr:hypothetical protein MCHI_003134 [Candidatus Magnetoovum chiemensis]